MNDRFKFRVWNIDKSKYDTDPNFVLDTNGILGEWDSIITYNEDRYIVEQCTGLKDKNGKLIFEGDLIKDRSKIKYQIMWKDARFVAVAIKEFDYMPDNLLNQNWLDIWKIEIIGNIHNQKKPKIATLRTEEVTQAEYTKLQSKHQLQDNVIYYIVDKKD